MSYLLARLLLPFSWLYAGVMSIRNWLYDKGYKKSETFAVPLINVGNLRVGGTGKTPHVSWLVAELRRQGQRPAILSRGYGRATSGPRLTGPADSAATVGDEPWQYYQQFGPAASDALAVPVAVAEDRRLGVRLLLAKQPVPTVVVLDDAYQHRAVRPALNILLTELARPFWADFVLPAGRLRESRAGAGRRRCGHHHEVPARFARRCPNRSCPASASLRAAGGSGAVFGLRLCRAPAVAGRFTARPPRPVRRCYSRALPSPPRSANTWRPAAILLVFMRISLTITPSNPHDLAALRAQWQSGWPIFTTAKDAARLQAPGIGSGAARLADLCGANKSDVFGQWRGRIVAVGEQFWGSVGDFSIRLSVNPVPAAKRRYVGSLVFVG